MPVANKYELSDVLDACDYYLIRQEEELLEYKLRVSMTSRIDIRELTAILKRRNCHLNLIPVNPIKERNFKKPDRKMPWNLKINLKKRN